MKTSEEGLEFIRQQEGCRLKPYRDVAGYWTVGVGHLIKKGEPVAPITEARAMELLALDVADAERAIANMVKVQLNQNQFDALASFVFNLGARALQSSTLLKRLNRSDYAGAAAEFGKWANAGGRRVEGLVRRRAAERKLFETPVEVAAAAPAPAAKEDGTAGSSTEDSPAASFADVAAVPGIKDCGKSFLKVLFGGAKRAASWVATLGLSFNAGWIKPWVVIIIIMALAAGFAFYTIKKRKR